MSGEEIKNQRDRIKNTINTNRSTISNVDHQINNEMAANYVNMLFNSANVFSPLTEPVSSLNAKGDEAQQNLVGGNYSSAI